MAEEAVTGPLVESTRLSLTPLIMEVLLLFFALKASIRDTVFLGVDCTLLVLVVIVLSLLDLTLLLAKLLNTLRVKAGPSPLIGVEREEEEEGVTTSVLEMALLLLLMAEDKPFNFQPFTANLVP
jgi:hypothetical protein